MSHHNRRKELIYRAPAIIRSVFDSSYTSNIKNTKPTRADGMLRLWPNFNGDTAAIGKFDPVPLTIPYTAARATSRMFDEVDWLLNFEPGDHCFVSAVLIERDEWDRKRSAPTYALHLELLDIAYDGNFGQHQSLGVTMTASQDPAEFLANNLVE